MSFLLKTRKWKNNKHFTKRAFVRWLKEQKPRARVGVPVGIIDAANFDGIYSETKPPKNPIPFCPLGNFSMENDFYTVPKARWIHDFIGKVDEGDYTYITAQRALRYLGEDG